MSMTSLFVLSKSVFVQKRAQVLLHKLDSSQDAVVQKVDAQKLVADNLLNSITGAFILFHGFRA